MGLFASKLRATEHWTSSITFRYAILFVFRFCLSSGFQDHRSTKINTLASEIIEEFFSSGNGDLSMTEEDLKLNDDSGVDTVNIPKFQF